jgi:hypothetical protein
MSPFFAMLAALAASAAPFEGQQQVTVAQLVQALESVARSMESDPAVAADFRALAAAERLSDDPQTFREYVRIKLVFEGARDGGFWRLRWAITNREPRSDAIWAQWKRAAIPESDGGPQATATAECDELSALFAFLVRQLGVKDVGLFWPTSNHTVAVWTAKRPGGEAPARVVVPTSQVFLDREQSLGTRTFDPATQRTIYPYTRRDVPETDTLPGDLARFFLEQARRHAARPQRELQQARNQRSEEMGGS